MALKAVFFDLDGTLLPMDQELFLKAYFQGLCKKLAPYGYEPEALIKAIWVGTEAMIQNDGRRSNEAVFWQKFCAIFGEEAVDDEPIFAEFYQKEFQEIQAVCGYHPKAKETVKLCHALGLPVILATNPIFPAIATESRITWAGLEKEDFKLITTYENIGFSKPNPAYYAELLERFDLKGEECLMVGNDAGDDLPAGQLGMEVFLLTDCLINKNNILLDDIPNGGFDELQNRIKELAGKKSD